MQKLIQVIWRLVLTIWAQRNTHLATQTALSGTTPDDLQRDALKAEISEAQFNGPFQTLPEDHPHLFDNTDFKKLKEASLSTMTLWIKNYESSVLMYQQHLDGRINNPIDRGPAQSTILRFFAQAQPPTHPSSTRPSS